MDRMNRQPMPNTGMDKLEALWAEYRAACPDPEASANFMPLLWQKIETRRAETTSVFRHMVQAWVMAALALTLLIAVLLPRLQKEPTYSANTYVEVLDDAHANDAVDLLAGGAVE
jgi:anti-sigma-K factor RskA